MMWRASKRECKRRRVAQSDDESEEDNSPLPPLVFNAPRGGATIYHHNNSVYFNDDITDTTAFALNRELRSVDNKLKMIEAQVDIKTKIPIYLYITTNGGSIHAALSVVDCINSLHSPVHTVVDGFVASAGTIISLAGSKRYIQPNAYMLIHQLRSGVWGKMNEIDDEYNNLKKLMDHIQSYYIQHTKISRKVLEKVLQKDVMWNADECIAKGLVHEVYSR